MHLSGVRPSVRLSVCPIRSPHAAAVGLLLCCGPGGHEISTDCCTAGGQQHGAQQQMRV